MTVGNLASPEPRRLRSIHVRSKRIFTLQIHERDLPGKNLRAGHLKDDAGTEPRREEGEEKRNRRRENRRKERE